ncbi:type II toxin-antitoxin system HipA family toxin, partial [bacterium]
VKAGPGAFLKITTDDRFPHAVENEAFFMAMAADCGLPTAHVERVVDSAGESALLVHRFDRKPAGRWGMKQLHQEDALQLLDLYPLDKYEVTVEEIGESVRKVVASWPQSGTALILQFAFGYLIGNHDQHAKNVSVLEVQGDLWGLSPIYDMLCTLVYGDGAPALTLNGQDEELTRADFVALTQTFGIREAPVLRRLDLMLAKARPWLDRLGEIGFDPLLTGRLRGALVERHAALAG